MIAFGHTALLGENLSPGGSTCASPNQLFPLDVIQFTSLSSFLSVGFLGGKRKTHLIFLFVGQDKGLNGHKRSVFSWGPEESNAGSAC